MVRKVLVAFIVALAIPVAGFFTAEWILGELMNGQPVPPEMIAYCGKVSLFADEGCGVVRRLVMLRDVSFWSGVAAFDLMALYFVTAMVAGRSRELNAAIFPLLIPLSLLIVTALVFVQGAILTYTVAAAEIHAIGRLHIWLIGMIGLGALFGGFKLIAATVRLGRRPSTRIFAKSLDRTRAPEAVGICRRHRPEGGRQSARQHHRRARPDILRHRGRCGHHQRRQGGLRRDPVPVPAPDAAVQPG